MEPDDALDDLDSALTAEVDATPADGEESFQLPAAINASSRKGIRTSDLVGRTWDAPDVVARLRLNAQKPALANLQRIADQAQGQRFAAMKDLASVARVGGVADSRRSILESVMKTSGMRSNFQNLIGVTRTPKFKAFMDEQAKQIGGSFKSSYLPESAFVETLRRQQVGHEETMEQLRLERQREADAEAARVADLERIAEERRAASEAREMQLVEDSRQMVQDSQETVQLSRDALVEARKGNGITVKTFVWGLIATAIFTAITVVVAFLVGG